MKEAEAHTRAAPEAIDSFKASVEGALVLSIPRGADLHDGIISACSEAGVRDAAIAEGHATLDRVVIHRVTSLGFPIIEAYETLEGPHELVSLVGLLIDGELHAHITVADTERVAGGHLHPGSRVLYLAEVVLLPLTFAQAMTRRHASDTNLWLMQPKDSS